MTAPFSPRYADAYDDLYRAKDYKAECDLALREAAIPGRSSIRRILDLGCGTGGHALVLSARGFEVTGVDRSDAMLEIARGKAAALRSATLRFVAGDLCRLDLDMPGSFDLALMMFAVLGYQHSNDDVVAALSGVTRALTPGGVFVFDCWFGPAVLRQQPGERVKTIDRAGGKLIRIARGDLDVMKHLCTVRYQLWSLPDTAPAEFTEETHVMRYFFPLELEMLLGQAGLRLRRMVNFDAPDRMPDEDSWNVLCVAERL
jgi:SAM-dependent methyltransferase